MTATLDSLLPPVDGPEARVVEAMRYACLNGGKRLRPFLVVSSAALFDVPRESALRTAAAVEMIHCYSLVHDDLPVMDDSDLRRGRLTTHKAYDDATAVLAGDGLLTEAFGVLADPQTHPDAEVRAALVVAIAAAAGKDGMVGGQMIDILEEGGATGDLDGITRLQRLKTGALIGAACEAGAILGRADERARRALCDYGARRWLGLPDSRRPAGCRGIGGGVGQADRTGRRGRQGNVRCAFGPRGRPVTRQRPDCHGRRSS